MVLTGGQIHDSEPAVTLLKGIKLKGKTILADKAYSCEQIRFFIAEHGAIFPLVTTNWLYPEYKQRLHARR